MWMLCFLLLSLVTLTLWKLFCTEIILYSALSSSTSLMFYTHSCLFEDGFYALYVFLDTNSQVLPPMRTHEV